MDVGLLLCKGKYCAVSPVHSRNGGYSQKARLWLTATTMSSEQKVEREIPFGWPMNVMEHFFTHMGAKREFFSFLLEWLTIVPSQDWTLREEAWFVDCTELQVGRVFSGYLPQLANAQDGPHQAILDLGCMEGGPFLVCGVHSCLVIYCMM